MYEGQADPNKIALCVAGPNGAENEISYQNLRDRVVGAAQSLVKTGVGEGDVILLRLGNTADFPIIFLAAITIGCIPVPTSAQLTQAEITKMAKLIAPKLTVAASGVSVPVSDCKVVDAGKLDQNRRGDTHFVRGDPNRPAYMIFTSGTSGQPNAVVHAHRAIWARRMMWTDWYGMAPNDRLMHAGAFNWTYTLGTGLLDPWSIGATAIIPSSSVMTEDLPTLIENQKATIFAAAPAVFRRLLREDIQSFKSLRHGLSAGEKLPAPTRSEWEMKTKCPIYEAFGMSECSTFISQSANRQANPDSLGSPQRGRKVAILGDEQIADFGEAGRIAIHASDPGLMLGYLQAPGRIDPATDGEWFLTGDMGKMSKDGSITYFGRADDLLNAGGLRVSPVEVEAPFSEHPDILECAAIEQRIKEDTSIITLCYVSDKALSKTELDRHCATTLAEYKRPRAYIRVDALPRGTNNKILRIALRKRYSK